MNVEDPIAVLSELAETAMRRLGADFKVTVRGDYRKFPLVLTIRVDEHEEEVYPDRELFEREGEEWIEEGGKEAEEGESQP